MARSSTFVPVSPSQRAGGAAEDLALHYLTSFGLRLVERNFRTRVGEIDLVMRDAAELVFVEVRARRAGRYGGAAESVGAAKRRRVRAAAQVFLLARFGAHAWPALRFDVVAVDAGQPRWLRAAF